MILIETIIRPFLFNRYYPLCGDDGYWTNDCRSVFASNSAWFNWMIFGVIILCLVTYFYSLYLTSLDFRNLIRQIPEKEISHVINPIYLQQVVPGAVYPIRITKPFMIRFDSNTKFSLYSLLAGIGLGAIVCITFLADTRGFHWLISAGTTFMVLLLGSIIVFHIFFNNFGVQVKQITSYDENTEELGRKYYIYSTFGISITPEILDEIRDNRNTEKKKR